MSTIVHALPSQKNRFIVQEIREKKSPMKTRLPSLNAVRVFETAARHGSFVKAADELCVTHGAVSRQIKQLEASLGLALFERRNRAVFLTRAGLQLHEVCREVMQRLEDGVRQLRQTVADSPLVVSCEPTVAMRWLIPRLGRFHATHPEVQLLLYAAGGSVDFAASHIDLALRRNDFHWGADCHAEPVAREWVAAVCAPALLEDGKLRPERQCRLHADSRPEAWEQWQKLSGIMLTNARSARYEHFYLSLQAAGAGLGVAVGSVYMVEDEMAEGRLTAPFGFVADGSEYVLLSPQPFAADERRQKFLTWLRTEMRASEAKAALAAAPGLR
jgi:DNA-binding transcriptional LysR family regulator